MARPAGVPPEARIDALEAAGDLDDERRSFPRRAAFLLDLGSTSATRYPRGTWELPGSLLGVGGAGTTEGPGKALTIAPRVARGFE